VTAEAAEAPLLIAKRFAERHTRCGTKAPADGQALFNIFLNLPEANEKTSVDAPNFVGR